MLAIWGGIVGAVLLAGGAQAACPVERTIYQAVDTGSRLYGTQIVRPDLVGAKFSVLRQASEYRSTNEGFSEPTRIARRTLLLSGAKGRFVVEQRVASHSSPSVTAMSWSADDTEKKLDWAKRDRAQEKRVFSSLSEMDVLDGPLSSLQVKPVACR